MQKVQANEDLRVQRTRKLLQKALLDLTVEKGFAAITVRDITERAMVNRSTFYRHYLDKYDLLEQYMTEVYTPMSDEEFLAEKRAQLSPELPTGLVRLLRHVQVFADFYRVMLGQKGDAAFTDRFRKNSEKRFRYLLSMQGEDTDANMPPTEMRLNYLSCAGLGAILWWLENGQPCTPEQLALWIGQLSNVGLALKLGDLPINAN